MQKALKELWLTFISNVKMCSVWLFVTDVWIAAVGFSHTTIYRAYWDLCKKTIIIINKKTSSEFCRWKCHVGQDLFDRKAVVTQKKHTLYYYKVQRSISEHTRWTAHRWQVKIRKKDLSADFMYRAAATWLAD